MAKEIVYSETERKIVEALASADGAMTLAEISEKIKVELKSGNIVALMKKGNVASDGERVIVCETCGAKRKVKEYSFVKAI